ncbi:MAG TPA: hypothetical protein VFE10_09095 [Phenylobacterium sp.]|nr:hypothetical protein [Phenylobacterium sp.]
MPNWRRREILTFALSGCAVCSAAWSATSSDPAPTAFVQDFYDWYLRHISDRNGPGFEVALQDRPQAFSTQLTDALRADLRASARVRDEVVGLDFDPFLGSQDPDPKYQVGDVRRAGATWLAKVHGVRSGRRSTRPDVTAEVARGANGWLFVNFHYPDGLDLLATLAELRRSRR